MSYHHFTIVDRITIKSYLDLEFSVSKIARLMKVDKSSISREIRRNQIDDNYEPIKAERSYLDRRKHCHKIIKITPEIKEHIENRIKLTWSPEQIVGRKEDKPPDFPSTSTIYYWIHKGYLLDGNMNILRRKGKFEKVKEYRRAGKFEIGRTIRKRPKEVYKRATVGDWEGDTVVGKHGTKPCFVTLLERKSRLYLAGFMPNRATETVCDKIIEITGDIPKKFIRTITVDRGKEFTNWRTLEKRLGCKTYFADPYCSWQKGSNENSNGLLREFFPKGEDLTNTSPEKLLRALYLINNRPRKCLDYRTPNEVFYEEILKC